MLQQIAKHEQVKIENLTPQQIIKWFERDAEIKRFAEGEATPTRGESAGSLQW